MIEYTCPVCGTPAMVDDDANGMLTLCPACNRQLQIASVDEGGDEQSRGAGDPAGQWLQWLATRRGILAAGVGGVGLAAAIMLFWRGFGQPNPGPLVRALLLLGMAVDGVLTAGAVFTLRRPPSPRPAAGRDQYERPEPVPSAVSPLAPPAPPMPSPAAITYPNPPPVSPEAIYRDATIPPVRPQPVSRPGIVATPKPPPGGGGSPRVPAPKPAPPKPARPPAPAGSPLLQRTTCPHCWHTFRPEDVLWISAHGDLVGDALLGAEQPARFLPTRFGVDGNALDARGVRCTGLACPNCHLPVPRALLEVEPFFVSVLGAPGSGKSYLLAAMIWQLREVLSRDFAVAFQDADLVANGLLNSYEQSLFLNPRQGELVPLAKLIAKTPPQDHLYTVNYGSQQVRYPQPFLFTVGPSSGHPNADARQRLSRLLCLYDNAGEHFQPGEDTNRNQMTRHLAQSRLLFFLFDPTKDLRFRQKYRDALGDLPALSKPERQDVVLLEVAARIRRYTNLPQASKHPHPLVVLVTKCDAWMKLLGPDALAANPWKRTRKQIYAIDSEQVATTSRRVRGLLKDTCPELLSAAESFAEQVVYVPVSALGRKPVVDPNTGEVAIQPNNLKPLWAAAPMVYGLQCALSGLIPALKASMPSSAARPGRPGDRRPTSASAADEGGK